MMDDIKNEQLLFTYGRFRCLTTKLLELLAPPGGSCGTSVAVCSSWTRPSFIVMMRIPILLRCCTCSALPAMKSTARSLGALLSLTLTNSRLFKANLGNSSTFKVFKAPYEPDTSQQHLKNLNRIERLIRFKLRRFDKF